MSDYRVVDKEQLKDYRDYKYGIGMLHGLIVASIVIGFVTGTPAAYVFAVVWGMASVLVWYLEKDDFSNIRQVVKDAEEGENQ